MKKNLLIDGIEILYSTYYTNLFIQIFFWILLGIAICLVIAEIVTIIKDREWKLIWAPIVTAIIFGIFLLGLYQIYPSYCEYHVKIDDTVPYNYIVENFNNIQHEGGNCYNIIINEE